MTAEVSVEYQNFPDVKFFLCSDVHLDNPKCVREKFFADLDKAKAAGAGIMIFGDLFCAMQGKYDPRGTKQGIRPEHNVNNYLDALVDDTTALLEPYKDNLLIITQGNHETSILRRMETDLTDRLCHNLRGLGSQVVKGGYHGFVQLKFRGVFKGKIQNTITRNMYFHHGKFGGVVTKGMLGTGRHASVVPDADYIVTGHTHNRWAAPFARFRLKANGSVRVENQWHIKTGTYKEELAKPGGWAVEKIAMPKELGGVTLRQQLIRPKVNGKSQYRVHTEVTL